MTSPRLAYRDALGAWASEGRRLLDVADAGMIDAKRRREVPRA